MNVLDKRDVLAAFLDDALLAKANHHHNFLNVETSQCFDLASSKVAPPISTRHFGFTAAPSRRVPFPAAKMIAFMRACSARSEHSARASPENFLYFIKVPIPFVALMQTIETVRRKSALPESTEETAATTNLEFCCASAKQNRPSQSPAKPRANTLSRHLKNRQFNSAAGRRKHQKHRSHHHRDQRAYSDTNQAIKTNQQHTQN